MCRFFHIQAKFWLFLVSTDATRTLDQLLLDMQTHSKANGILMTLKLRESHGSKKKVSTTYKKAKSKPGGIGERFWIDS